MKPSPADVACLCGLLRGAGPAAEAKKGRWWQAAAQLAASPNVGAEQQRDLQHLLLLRQHGWDAAAAGVASRELEAKRKAEAAEAAVAEAARQRHAHEEAAARAAAEAAKAEEQVKAAAAKLAQLQRRLQEIEAALAAGQAAQRAAEAAAEAAARRRAEDDRAATATRRQAADAQAEAARAQQAAAEAAATAEAAGGTAGVGGAVAAGRHWLYAFSGGAVYGPVAAAELVAWLYEDVMLGQTLQVSQGAVRVCLLGGETGGTGGAMAIVGAGGGAWGCMVCGVSKLGGAHAMHATKQHTCVFS
jgi:hypothetical protein